MLAMLFPLPFRKTRGLVQFASVQYSKNEINTEEIYRTCAGRQILSSGYLYFYSSDSLVEAIMKNSTIFLKVITRNFTMPIEQIPAISGNKR